MTTLSDTQTHMKDDPADALVYAKDRAAAVAASDGYAQFVESIRKVFPWRFQAPLHVLERDYLRIVDHHLAHLIPLVHPYMESGTRRVFDFGCGSGELGDCARHGRPQCTLHRNRYRRGRNRGSAGQGQPVRRRRPLRVPSRRARGSATFSRWLPRLPVVFLGCSNMPSKRE